MLKQVRTGEELPEVQLKNYLIQHNLISSDLEEISIRQFSTGYSNLTYLIETGRKSYVLRRPPFGAIKRGHDMGREYQVLSGLNNGFDKIPQVYAYCENESVIGAPFYLMEYVEGFIIDAQTALEWNISTREFEQIADCWMDTFVELHQLDYEKLGLSSLGKPEGYIDRQVRNWGKQYYRAATDKIVDADFVIQWLQDHQPASPDHSLIHNDYKYDNVVFGSRDWSEIKAILDWEMCTLGDPLMDLGTTLAYWFIPSDHEMILQGWPSPTTFPGNPSREDIVESYAQLSGRNVNNISFYYTFWSVQSSGHCSTDLLPL